MGVGVDEAQGENLRFELGKRRVERGNRQDEGESEKGLVEEAHGREDQSGAVERRRRERNETNFEETS